MQDKKKSWQKKQSDTMIAWQEEGTSCQTKFSARKRKKKRAGHIESSFQLQFTVMLDPVKQA